MLVTIAAFLAAAFVSLAARYRASDRLLRQQVKWLALVAAVFVACQLIAVLVVLLGEPWLDGVADTLVAIIALFGIPAAMAIAMILDGAVIPADRCREKTLSVRGEVIDV